ncbi:hypothetical protein HGA91_06210 [candidate division WWE3 bacterium]|nr:hypothetical protein [candidate division WWE3 bacterium]
MDYDILSASLFDQKQLSSLINTVGLTKNEYGYFTSKGIWLRILPTDKNDNHFDVYQYFGFTVKTHINIEFSGTTDNIYTPLFQLISTILQATSDDLIVLATGELVVLKRIKQKLTLNSDFDNWEKPQYDILTRQIPSDTQRVRIPSPYL